MKTSPTLMAAFCLLLSVLTFTSCASVSGPAGADPAQVARLSAVASVLVQSGAALTLQKNPDCRPQLLAIAEAIEQAAALPEAPPPNNLINLASSAAAKFGGTYGMLAGFGLQAGFSVYQKLYAANATTALDKQPAFRAVLVSMAQAIRAAAAGAPVPPAAGGDLTAEDFILKAAN